MARSARVTILSVISNADHLITSMEIADRIGLSKRRVTSYLTMLYKEGLVTRSKVARADGLGGRVWGYAACAPADAPDDDWSEEEEEEWNRALQAGASTRGKPELWSRKQKNAAKERISKRRPTGIVRK